jgi:shikimate 5-dehydrogenase
VSFLGRRGLPYLYMCLPSPNRSVTMPLKSEILKHLDEISPVSEATGACNTIVRVKKEDGSIKLVGTNTDFLGKVFTSTMS